MEKINRVADIKDALLVNLYHTDPIDRVGLLNWIKTQRERVKPFIGDVSVFLNQAIKEGKNILMEGQLGTMKDPDNGIYPMVTSSSPLAGFASVSCGIAPYEIKKIVVVSKAYSSAVGAGEFISKSLAMKQFSFATMVVTAVNTAQQQVAQDVLAGMTA